MSTQAAKKGILQVFIFNDNSRKILSLEIFGNYICDCLRTLAFCQEWLLYFFFFLMKNIPSPSLSKLEATFLLEANWSRHFRVMLLYRCV